MKIYIFSLIIFASLISFADNPNWPLELKPGRPKDITAMSAAAYQFKGYCVPGGGDVTINFGTLSFVTPCRGVLGAYKHIGNVSAEVTTNPIKHCVDQGVVVGVCSLPVSNFLASPSLSFNQSPLMDINSNNLTSYTISGDCAPVGASISIDIGAQIGIIAGLCDSDHKFILTGDVTAVSDGLGIVVSASIVDGPNTTIVGNTVDKNTGVPTVSIDLAPDIIFTNSTSYDLSGSCNKNGQPVIVSVGGVSPVVAPVCTLGAWSIVGLDVSAVAEGSVLITADHSDSLGNPAVQAVTTVFKDSTIPLVAITSAPDIIFTNSSSYDFSGTCSENGEVVMVAVGGVSPGVQPLCSGGTWSVVGLDVSAVAEGVVLITADHTDPSGNVAVQATANVNKDVTTLALVSGAYEYIDGTFATSCLEYFTSTSYEGEGDGKYRIDPDGAGGSSEFVAMCDMTTNGGGWTLMSNRSGNTTNIESCGATLGDFFNGACGDVDNITFSDSYSIGSSSVRSNIVSDGDWMFRQYNSGGTLDADDAYTIFNDGSDLFPTSVGPVPVPYFETPVDSVCDVNGINCDTTNVFFLWLGHGWYNSSRCNGGQNTSISYKGNYGYCHNGLGAYASNSLFGNRSGYNETKLWNYGGGARVYQERIWAK